MIQHTEDFKDQKGGEFLSRKPIIGKNSPSLVCGRTQAAGPPKGGHRGDTNAAAGLQLS